MTVIVAQIAYASSIFIHPDLLLVYFCTAVTRSVTSSEEHDAYSWANEQSIQQHIAPKILVDFEQHQIFQQLVLT